MTVADLIAELECFDGDLDVCFGVGIQQGDPVRDVDGEKRENIEDFVGVVLE